MSVLSPPGPPAPPGPVSLPPSSAAPPAPATGPRHPGAAEPAGRAAGSGTDWVAGLVGVLALLGGSTALTAVLSDGAWVLPLIEVVVVVSLLGVGGRLVRLPTWGVVVLQVAGLAVAITALFTTSGIGGVIPNASSVGELHTLLAGAREQIVATVPPAPATPELSLLVAITVGLAALIVDFLIAAAKAPALVALPLLCLFSVPASISTEMLPWYSFALPAALYALLLAVAGHPGRRTAGRAGREVTVQGTVITAVAIVIALVGATAFTGVGTAGRLPRTNATAGLVGLSAFTTLRGSLERSTPVDLLQVRGLNQPDYLRTVGLTRWTNNKGFTVGDLESDGQIGNGPLPDLAIRSGSTPITVTSTAFRDKFLPLFAGTTAVNGLSTPWTYDSALDTGYRDEATNPGTFQLLVQQDKPSDAALRKDTVTAGGVLTDVGALPAAVRQQAVEVTAAAATPFDKALALKQWFTDPVNKFQYSLQVPPGNSGDALIDFLSSRQGYCEQYASALAVMLRSLGIPTRVGIGFTQGTVQPDGSYVIDSHDAHAWVEVRFDRSGWVRFDPTPLTNGQGLQQGFQNGPVPTGTATSTSSGAGAPSIPQVSRRPDGGDTQQPADTSVAPIPVAAAASAHPLSLWWIFAGVLVLVLAVAVLLPAVLRWGRRRSRLTVMARGGPAGAAAAWVEISDLAIDFGVGVRPAESSRAAANRLARRAQLDERDRARLRQVVVAAEAAWYGPPTGPGPAGAASADATGRVSPAGPDRPGAGAGSAATAVLDRPAAGHRQGSADDPGSDFPAAVRAVRAGLTGRVGRSFSDRWFPRSLRPRRD